MKTNQHEPPLNAIYAYVIFALPNYYGAGPGHKIPHPPVAIEEPTGRVLKVATLVRIHSNRLTMAKTLQAFASFCLQRDGWYHA